MAAVNAKGVDTHGVDTHGFDAHGFDAHGWYCGARRYASPNCDARPAGTAVDLLVIHNISLPAGQFGLPHIADLFTNRLDASAHPSFASLGALRVSAHFLVRRDGSLLQFVAADARAWHAGVSAFEGRARCNDFSIGIELEGTDLVAFAPAQYAALATLTAALQGRFPLRAVRGHADLAPGRKTDPGPCFDWRRYAELLAETVPSGGAADPCLAGARPALAFALRP